MDTHTSDTTIQKTKNVFFQLSPVNSIIFPHKSFHITLTRFLCIGFATQPIRIDPKNGSKLDCKTKILYNVSCSYDGECDGANNSSRTKNDFFLKYTEIAQHKLREWSGVEFEFEMSNLISFVGPTTFNNGSTIGIFQ